jgi:hypothetical protein
MNPSTARLKKVKRVSTCEVRCLGPREPEHTFRSSDPAAHRICPKCERAIKLLNLSKWEAGSLTGPSGDWHGPE